MKLMLETLTIEDVLVLRCQGRLTYGPETTIFSEKVAQLIPNRSQLVVDLCGVEAIDSAGLGELVLVLMWAQASGCSMKLAVNDHVQQLLELTNLVSVLESHASVDGALLSCRQIPESAKAADCHAA